MQYIYEKKSLGLRQAYQLCIIYTQELFVMSKKPARRSPLDTQWIPIIPRWIKTHEKERSTQTSWVLFRCLTDHLRENKDKRGTRHTLTFIIIIIIINISRFKQCTFYANYQGEDPILGEDPTLEEHPA